MIRAARLTGLAFGMMATMLVSSAAHAAADARFNFNTYEFSEEDQDAYGQVPSPLMAARAEAFIAAHHPMGSSAQVAIKDVEHAGAQCRPFGAPGHTLCRFARPSHGVTALAGSALWRIDVYATPGTDQVDSITVARRLAAD